MAARAYWKGQIRLALVSIPGKRDEMLERSGGGHTVPQVFIDGRHVGGSDDLAALDRNGELDGLLQGASA